jgi:hypothetical protein
MLHMFLGNHLGAMQKYVTVKDSLLKTKHVAISYHKTPREATSTGITHPVKILGTH